MPIKSPSLVVNLFAGTALLLAAGACSPTVHNRGNLLDDEQIAMVKAGESTRRQVLTNLGSPSTVDAFDENTWYYIGQRKESWAFLRPEVTQHKVLAVRFNDQGIVEDVRTVGIDEIRDVQVVARRTPTRGREPTFFRSLYELLITGPVRTLDRGGPTIGGLEE